MPCDPVGQPLAGVRFGVNQPAGAQHTDENLDVVFDTCLRLNHHHGLPAVIHLHFFPRFLRQPHHRLFLRFGPLPVQFAELAVAVAIGMLFVIFCPEQHAGYARTAEFLFNFFPIGQGALFLLRLPGGKQALAQFPVPHLCWQRPCQPGLLGAFDILSHCAVRPMHTAACLSVAQFELPLQPQDFADFSHGQFPFCHAGLQSLFFGQASHRVRVLTSPFSRFRCIPSTDSGAPQKVDD